MKKYLPILLSLFLLSTIVEAQDAQDTKQSGFFIHHRLYKAHKAFQKQHYQTAAERYEKLYVKEKLDDIQKGDYAEVLLYLHQSVKAENILDEIPNRTLHEEELLIRAAMYNGDYAKAESIIKSHPDLDIYDMSIAEDNGLEEFIQEVYLYADYEITDMSINSGQADFAPYEKDGTLYFSSDRGRKNIFRGGNKWKNTAYLNIYEADANNEVNKISSKINTHYHDGPICFNSTGDIVFVTRNNYTVTNYGNNKEDDNTLTIFMSRLQDDGEWGEFIPLPVNNATYSISHPFLSKDDGTLYFVSDMPGGYGGTDIYKMSFDGQSFGEVQNVGAPINTDGNEMFPFIGPDDRFYFSSDGYAGFGGYDIYVAKENDGIMTVKHMGYPINSSVDDFSFFLRDDHSGYFASNRKGGVGSDDIYKFQIIKPVPFSADIDVRVIDKNTQAPLAAAEVHVSDSLLHIMDMGVTDDSGMLTQTVMDNVPILHFDVLDYDGYKPFIQDIPLQDDVYILALEPLDLGLYGYVYDVNTNEQLKGAIIQFFDEQENLIVPTVNDSGHYRQGLMFDTKYSISVTKEGYLPYDFNVNSADLSSWEERNIPLSTTLEIRDILYDFDKWAITSRAARELDKLVTYLERHADIHVRLEAHTDARGSSTYNAELSAKRAQSATDYIVRRGIAIERITSIGFGEEQLKNNCADNVECSPQEHQENRRTEIRIVLDNND